MKQFFLIGASSVYGVGGSNGGWSTLLKTYLHEKMYQPGGLGETIEVFNFAIGGADVQFVLDTFPDQIKHYGRHGDITIIAGVGGNNAKATGTPENFVCSVEEYTEQMSQLIDLLQAHASKVLMTSNTFVDESKTNPKISPFDGSSSYFTNERRDLFRNALSSVCQEKNVQLLDLGIDEKSWLSKYIYEDGLHPNADGHQLIFEAIVKELGI